MTALTGFTRILGLGHIVWLPLLYFLWTRLAQIPAEDFFGLWVRALMAINATSLVIDAVDVSRYMAGDREETVKGLSEDVWVANYYFSPANKRLGGLTPDSGVINNSPCARWQVHCRGLFQLPMAA